MISTYEKTHFMFSCSDLRLRRHSHTALVHAHTCIHTYIHTHTPTHTHLPVIPCLTRGPGQTQTEATQLSSRVPSLDNADRAACAHVCPRVYGRVYGHGHCLVYPLPPTPHPPPRTTTIQLERGQTSRSPPPPPPRSSPSAVPTPSCVSRSVWVN